MAILLTILPPMVTATDMAMDTSTAMVTAMVMARGPLLMTSWHKTGLQIQRLRLRQRLTPKPDLVLEVLGMALGDSEVSTEDLAMEVLATGVSDMEALAMEVWAWAMEVLAMAVLAMADMEESGKYMCTNVCDIFMLVGQK